jgi:integrating conjugative element protein (TIGR03749 family)
VPGLRACGHAVEILRWERLPLAVPLVVGQERVVFIERNVRIGVPPTVGEQLRVQSAGGAIYLRASAPIPPTRLQLQDVESGALILLDIAAEPAKAGQPALEPVRIVEGDVPAALRRAGQAGDHRTTMRSAPYPQPEARHAGGRGADALRGAEPLRAAAHRGARSRHRPRQSAPQHLELDPPCCPRCRCARRRWPLGGSKTSG